MGVISKGEFNCLGLFFVSIVACLFICFSFFFGLNLCFSFFVEQNTTKIYIWHQIELTKGSALV